MIMNQLVRRQLCFVLFVVCISLFYAESPNKIKQCKHGTFILSDYDVDISEHMRMYGEWAEGELNLFLSLIKPGDIVVDAGANIGAFTVPLAKKVGPNGRVHSFEPQKVINQRLTANVVLNDLENVDIYLSALGNYTGFIEVPIINYAAHANFGALSLTEPLENQTPEWSYKVPIHRLDDINFYNPYTQSNCPSFIKMDVERMEKWVLQGAADTLKRCRPFVHMENNAESSSKGLIEYLFEIDYIPFWDLRSPYNPDNFNKVDKDTSNGYVSMNMLCVPKEKLSEFGGNVMVELPRVEKDKPYLADYKFTTSTSQGRFLTQYQDQ